MIREYKTVEEISGPLMMVRMVENVTYEDSMGLSAWVDGKRVLNFGSYNYAGMSGRKETMDAAKAAIDALLAQTQIHIVINNAGVDRVGRFYEASSEDVRDLLQVNLIAPMELCRQVMPGMIKRGRGHIVNVSSISADTVSTNRGEYCLSKAGVGMATQLWAVRLAPEGILVYEVEFKSGNMEYSYEIDAASGAVLKHESERDD